MEAEQAQQVDMPMVQETVQPAPRRKNETIGSCISAWIMFSISAVVLVMSSKIVKLVLGLVPDSWIALAACLGCFLVITCVILTFGYLSWLKSLFALSHQRNILSIATFILITGGIIAGIVLVCLGHLMINVWI